MSACHLVALPTSHFLRTPLFGLALIVGATCFPATLARAEVTAKEGTLTLPTYSWSEDVNPKLWPLEQDKPYINGPDTQVVYPYVMQDAITRDKADHTYKALFLENEYLKVTCLPELGGRLHSVLDKTTGKEMFHCHPIIKPGLIAQRGAWVAGGVEWNTGPHGHTVSTFSPVDFCVGRNPDGSAYLEVGNQEQIFRTRWTVRVTLHPGRAYLDEQLRVENPTDTLRPYYLWNCTAYPNRPGTRLIYPMSLGSDHAARDFFRWPVDKGRDMTWLKNYRDPSSVFAVACSYDFFGAYDVDADYGLVQTADHHQVPGKKAWTWGENDSGKLAEQNLADSDPHYIEVQSGPLPTQSDYGPLGPHDQIAWRECWYPVHGLGDGFEFANRDLAAQTSRRNGRLEVRLLATGNFPQSECLLARDGHSLIHAELNLTPSAPLTVAVNDTSSQPVDITVTSREGRVLATFTTPLPIAKVDPPDPATFVELADDRLSVEELYLKGRKFDRGTNRTKGREYYEKALARDSGHVASLRALAVLDMQAGQYADAIVKLKKALTRDGEDGMSWYCQGVCHLRLGQLQESLACGYHASRLFGTLSLGYDLAGRAAIQLGDKPRAIAAFEAAVRAEGDDPCATDHLMLAKYACGDQETAVRMARRRTTDAPQALVPLALLGLEDEASLKEFARQARAARGDADFELVEASLVFAEVGLVNEASRIVRAACVDAAPPGERGFMPLYYLAWYASLRGDTEGAARWLVEAAQTTKDRVFASRPEDLEVLRYAVKRIPSDAQAHLQLGCLLAFFGRVEEAVVQWRQAGELNPKLSIAWRNLGLAAAAKKEVAQAETYYRKAIEGRPTDQTLYRDLGEILAAAGRGSDVLRLLQSMPPLTPRRGEITLLLARSYCDEHRHDDAIKLLESTPYFVNWEGGSLIWRIFRNAHVERGRQRLDKSDVPGALADFDAALTYPANLNVGRSEEPEEAVAQYWRGKALAALGQTSEAHAAWKAGAAGTVEGVPPNESYNAIFARQQNEYIKKCKDALAEKK